MRAVLTRSGLFRKLLIPALLALSERWQCKECGMTRVLMFVKSPQESAAADIVVL